MEGVKKGVGRGDDIMAFSFICLLFFSDCFAFVYFYFLIVFAGITLWADIFKNGDGEASGKASKMVLDAG